MTNKNNDLRDGVLILAGISILLVLLRESSEIIVPFLLSLFIAIIAATPLNWLKNRGYSTTVSVVIVVTVITLVATLLAFLMGNTITQFNDSLPEYQARLDEVTNSAIQWAATKGINLEQGGILKALDPSALIDFANYMISGIGVAFSNILLILFTVIFMLIEAAGFSRKVSSIDGLDAESTLQRIGQVIESINRYASAKAIVSIATGILVWIALEIIGLDFAPLWGFLAFSLNFVPNIGSVIAAAPAILLAILQFNPAMALVVAAVYAIVNTVIGNIIEPMIMGQRVGLSTLAVFLSLVFWGWMFGPVGMLLSVPLSMVIKFTAQTNPQTQWIAVLLSPSPRARPGKENDD